MNCLLQRKKKLEQRILYFILFTELVAQRSHLGVLVERRRVGHVSVCGEFAAANSVNAGKISIDRHRARLRRTGTCLMVDVILLILLEIEHLVDGVRSNVEKYAPRWRLNSSLSWLIVLST